MKELTPLNILFLSSWYPNPKDPQEGIFVKKLALAAALNHKVTLIHVSFQENISKPKTTIFNHDSFTEHLIYIPPKSGLSKILLWRKHYSQAISSLGFLPDILHLNIAFPIAGVLMYNNLLKNVPKVYSESWSGFVNGSNIPFHKLALQRWLGKNSEAILPVSNFLKEGMTNAGIEGNYQVVGNVIDFPKNESKMKPDTTFRFLVVADLNDEIKNTSGIIQAFNRSRDKKSELHIVGGGNDFEKLSTLASESNPKRIRFHGRKTNQEVLEIMPGYNACVINSNFETFSVVCLEAIANKVPIIVTDCGGPSEFFEPDMGIMIKVGDNDELKNAIERMVFDPMEISQSTVEMVRNKYSSGAIGSRLNEIYRRLSTLQSAS